jgi:hypothetical protein
MYREKVSQEQINRRVVEDKQVGSEYKGQNTKRFMTGQYEAPEGSSW